MSSLPPPSGRPATMFPRPDPWVEQARRAAEHRARRRRRRRKWIVPTAIALVGVGGAVAWEALLDGDDDGAEVRSSPAPSTAAPAPAVAGSDPAATVAPTTTVPPEQLVEVDDVWLIDQGEGRFAWGVAISVPEGASNRSGVGVDVRLLASDGSVVEEREAVLDGISVEPTVVVGEYVAGREAVRIEFDVAVGVASAEIGPAGLLDVRAVELDESTGSVDGRVRSSATVEVTGVEMVLVWRDPEWEGDGPSPVVAVSIHEVERIRPGVEARFSIDLAELAAPTRIPDDILWMPSSDR